METREEYLRRLRTTFVLAVVVVLVDRSLGLTWHYVVLGVVMTVGLYSLFDWFGMLLRRRREATAQPPAPVRR